jgi:hypothetical protein
MTDADGQDRNGEITDANVQNPGGEKADANPQNFSATETESDAERQQPTAELADAGAQDSGGEKMDAFLQDFTYKKPDAEAQPPSAEITDAGAQDSGGEKADADLHYLFDLKPDAELPHLKSEMADENPQDNLGAKNGEQQQPPIVQRPQPAASRALLYVAAGVGLGILVGIGAAITWQQNRPAPAPEPAAVQEPTVSSEPRDMEWVDSSTVGLRGHLTTKWDGGLGYHLTIEPGQPAQQAGFALAVSEPPRPLSIEIQLKNADGVVLCSQQVLLKYDARKAAELAAAKPAKTKGKKRSDHSADLDRLEAQEQEREHGKDIFQNDIGPDGQIASISSQGVIPCPAQAYQSTAFWIFLPDFPTLDEQADLLKRETETRQADTTRSLAQKPAVRKRAAYKPATRSMAVFIEGDDAIVDYDVQGGMIETRAGKIFLVEKPGGDGNTAKWQDYPAYFHYRCDQTTSACTLMRAGTGVLHARLKK